VGKLLFVGALLIGGTAAAAAPPQAAPHLEVTVRSGSVPIADSFVQHAASVLRTAIRNPWIPFIIGFDPSTAVRRVAWPVLELLDGRILQIVTAGMGVWARR
jgi:hypothetical protein